MDKVRIHIYYKITEEPWGGGNSFLKALRNYILRHRSSEFEIVNDINGEYDILLMNGGHKDQGVYIDLEEVKKIQKDRGVKVVYRLDGARYKYNQTKSEMDDLQYAGTKISDFIIFQSNECVDSFRAMGYDQDNFVIIYNGVDQTMFNTEGKKFWDGKSKLKLFSANWSSNEHKGYPTISEFSLNDKVESLFIGNWNEATPQNNVKISPPLKQEDLAKYYRDCDVFLHAAENDPCPNVVVEALSSGLPVIYHNSGGTKELALDYGIPLDEVLDSSKIDNIITRMQNQYSELVKKIVEDKEKFSIDTIAQQYLDVFKKVLSK